MPETPLVGRGGYGSIENTDGLEREEDNRRTGIDINGGKNRARQNKSPKNKTTPSSSSEGVAAQDDQEPSKNDNLTDKYNLLEVLGWGSTSTCHRCVNKKTGENFACKIIDKRHIEQRFRGLLQQFFVEIEALKTLKHPNIIHLYDVYITNDKIYMVMELMEGGELFDYVVEKGTLTEEEASVMVRRITEAIVYMHDQNVIHRDLKPENLLLTKKVEKTGEGDVFGKGEGAIDGPDVKIIDFGLSKFLVPISPNSNSEGVEYVTAKSFLGTRGYLAPEMLQRREYDKAVDIWALGVIVFVLLCGCLPFDDDSSAVPSDATIREKFVLRFPRWAKNLSESAKDLLMHLLDCNAKTRYTAAQALAHPWVKGKSVKKGNYLESPRIIKTPGSVLRSGAGKKKNRVSELVNGRRRENKVNESPGKQKVVVRKNSF